MRRPYRILYLACLLILVLGCREGDIPILQINPPEVQPPSMEESQYSIKLITDNFEGIQIVIAASVALQKSNGVNHDRSEETLIWNFATAFTGVEEELEPIHNQFPVILKDAAGNTYDVFGHSSDGSTIEMVNSGLGYWFAFAALYPGVEIFDGTNGGESTESIPSPDWMISTDFVFQGIGFDGIPSINQPKFDNYDAESGPLLSDDQLVVAVSDHSGSVVVYPHDILDYHEVVNVADDDHLYSVTYCPLTGTAKVYWDSQQSQFGVSGFLYNSNLMPYDRATRSIWSQLDGRCVNGSRIGDRVNLLHHVETPWSIWKDVDVQIRILSRDTGYRRNYDAYPYGDYRSNHDFISVPVAVKDDRLKAKERVFSVIVSGKAKVYKKETFF